jgi:hypothetical protein
VVEECGLRLLLERCDACVQLVSAPGIRPATKTWPSGPVSATLLTDGTARQMSTDVSADGAFVAGSMSLTLGGSGRTIRISPFLRRVVKSEAFAPWIRKSSASMGRNSGSSALGSNRSRNWSD